MKDESPKRPPPAVKQSIQLDHQATAVRFSHCGQFMTAGCYDGRLRRFQQNEQLEFEAIPDFTEHGGWVEAFAHHPTLADCFSGDSWGKLHRWKHTPTRPETIWTVAEAHDGWIRGLDVAPDGKQIATCGLDRIIRVRDAENGKLVHQFEAPASETFCVRFHPLRNELFCGTLFGQVLRWDLEQGTALKPIDASDLYLLHRLQDVGGVRVLKFDREGKRLAVGGTRPKNGATVQGVPTVLVFDLESGEKTREFTFGAAKHCFVHDVEFHPDGYLMAVTSGTPGSGQIVLQDWDEETPFFSHAKIANCHSIALHKDKRRFAVAATNRGSNGNGRRLNKDGEYAGNFSPIHLFEIPEPEAGEPEAGQPGA